MSTSLRHQEIGLIRPPTFLDIPLETQNCSGRPIETPHHGKINHCGASVDVGRR